jgi:TRAP-type C4-dicarboxylate transport system permease large subunit
MIIFSMAAGGGISIPKLFLAGVIPGMPMCICLAIAAYFLAIKHNYPAEKFPGWKAVLAAPAAAPPGLVTAVIIVGGVLSGVFTVAQSGAFGALCALALTAVVYRSLSWTKFKVAVASSVRTTSVVMILIGAAGAFGHLLALYRMPGPLSEVLLSISDTRIVI